MPHDILMPAITASSGHGRIARWLKAEGDVVRAGDVLAEIETGSATMELEAGIDGMLAQITCAAGLGDIVVGTVIAVLEQGDAVVTVAADDVGIDMSPVPVLRAPVVMSEAWPPGTKCVSASVRDALRDALAEEMRRDADVFVMGEEVADYEGAHKVTQGLAQEFGPERVVDTPITEHGFAGLGVGAAYAGLRPVIEFMTFNFAMQAIDHIVNSAAKIRYVSGGQITCPIVFRGPNGTAPRVGAQHAQDYCAWFCNIPGLKVVAPYSAADAKGLLKSAIRDADPVVFLENEILYGQTFDVPLIDDYLVPIGKARIARPGHDVTIISFSIGMTYALEAAQVLAAQGIEAEVIDLRTLRPMDTDCIVASIRKTGRCVTVEEGWPQSGIGAEISARIMEHAFASLKAPVLRVSGKDVPMPYASRLEALAVPSVAEVLEAVEKVMAGRNGRAGSGAPSRPE